MFCGVGDLLETHALAEPHDDDDNDSFDNWLRRYLVTFPPHWISDLRDPTPLLEILWSDSPQSDRHWTARIPKVQFLRALLPPLDQPGLITVDGQWTADFPKRRTNFRIRSALVSPETATVLLRSLQSAQHAFGFSFPFDDDDELREINHPPYILSGWLQHIDQDARFDEKDPFRHGISAPRLVPGNSTIKLLNLEDNQVFRKEWHRQGSQQAVFRGLEWADIPERDDDWAQREQKSQGRWLQVDPDTLAELLRERQLDLIVGVHIERRIESEYGRSYDRETKKTKSAEKIFIFRSDGSVEDLQGRIGAWTKARH